MKYVFALLDIWRNFFVGRRKVPLVCICLFALLYTVFGFLENMFVGFLTLFGWVFVVPCAIWLIDEKRRDNRLDLAKSPE